MQQRIDGLGKTKKTAIFPKLIFALKSGLNLNPGDPNYDIKQLALECSTKRLYPDVLMYDKLAEITGNFKFAMGCRSFLSKWVNENGEEQNDGRFNCGVVTINLPMVALMSKTRDDFYKTLDRNLDICKEALDTRLNRLKKVKAKEAPVLYMNGACGVNLDPEDYIGDLLKNGRASISLGYIGLHETIKILYGKNMFGDDALINEGKKIMEHLLNKTKEWKSENGYGFSLYGTPSESLCFHFEKKLKEKFGEIEGITNKNWITNSFHLDVEQQCTAFEKIDFESQFQPYSSGGFISYVETNSMVNNPKALEALWDYAYDKVGYLAINTPSDMCFECGFNGEFIPTEYGFQCPNCGNENPLTCSCIRRISGYLAEPSQRPVNKGKHDEMACRYKHY